MSGSDGKRWKMDGPAGLAVIVLAVVFAATVLERLTRPTVETIDPAEAMPLPPLRVEGWLNTAGAPGPTAEELQGRWVVIDSWATDCAPCILSMPKLAAFHRRWQDRGVTVIGLTSEPSSRLALIEEVIDRVDGWDWPVGYGAGMVNGQLGVMMIPNYILFNPEGMSVWQGHVLEDLEEVLQAEI